MNKKQSILTKFFKSKRSNESSSPPQSDDESSYLPSKSRQMFDNPMYWTRVKSVVGATNQRMTIFDVETDILTDKSLKQVRKDSVREGSLLLFDPETFKSIQDQLTIETHKISKEQLQEYARGASEIRSSFSDKADRYDVDSGLFAAAEEGKMQSRSHQQQIPQLCQIDREAPNNPASPNRKRRSLRQLNVAERLKVVKMLSQRSRTGQEVADLFNLKLQAVRDLAKDVKSKQKYFIQKRKVEIRKVLEQASIVGVIQSTINSDQSIWSAKQVQERIKRQSGMQVSTRKVIGLMKMKFGLAYRRIKRVPFQGNSERNKVLRSLYAQKMFSIYSQGYHVINIDETWLPCTDFRRTCWNTRNNTNSQPDQVISHRVNMIAAISSEGESWLALTQCNTNEDVMQMFLSRLASVLTQQYGAIWREKVVFVMDGASYHRSAETRKCISHLKMKVILSAPYSYQTAPAELWFAHFKRGSFNPENIKTGKNSFREVSKLVFQQASTIKPDRIVLLFRHSILHLFNYLSFKPL